MMSKKRPQLSAEQRASDWLTPEWLRDVLQEYAPNAAKAMGWQTLKQVADALAMPGNTKPAPAAPPVLQADDAPLVVREYFRAVKHLQEHGYADWDGTANGMETTLTGCANAMREYAAAIRREAERAAFEKLKHELDRLGYASLWAGKETIRQVIERLADSPVSGKR